MREGKFVKIDWMVGLFLSRGIFPPPLLKKP